MDTDNSYRPNTCVIIQAAPNTVFVAISMIFLYISIVGVGFLPSRIHTDISQTGGADNIRQLFFVSVFLALTLVYSRRNGVASLATLLPLHIYLLFGWAALTLLWSPVPEIGGRRLMLLAIVCISCFMNVKYFGNERAIRFIFSCLLIFVVLSVIVGFLVPGVAIHQPDDPEPSIVGGWRGIFFHKNESGFVAAACLIWLVFSRWRGSYFLKGASFGACGFLLVMSGAKTPLIMLPVSLLLYFTFVLGPRKLGISFALIAVLFVGVLGLLLFDNIAEILSNPVSLTGRIGLWQSLIYFTQDNFWTGGGFGSIWDVGTASPLLPYLIIWMYGAAHGHNGYLDTIVAIGFPGLLLTLFSFFIWPTFKLIKRPALNIRTRDMILCLLLFIFLHNFIETDIMYLPHAPWTLLILLCAIAS
jgi:O-antigen ligase